MTEHQCSKPQFWDAMRNGIIGPVYEKNWPFNTRGLVFKGHCMGGGGSPVLYLEYCPFCGAKLGRVNELVEDVLKHPTEAEVK